MKMVKNRSYKKKYSKERDLEKRELEEKQEAIIAGLYFFGMNS